ncbi:MAG: ATP-dependent zinc metalloprotease FtsH [Candidatus Alcyoniella australis]|nr:ATP-dependent zinc metalloprotease FtsH [Candidatus Alcyoniella australis]
MKNLAAFLILILMFILLFRYVSEDTGVENLIYSDFLKKVQANEVTELTVKDMDFTGLLVNEQSFHTTGLFNERLQELLEATDPKVEYTVLPIGPSPLMSFLVTWFPILLVIGIFIFLMRQLQGGGGKAMSFGKSRARLMLDKHNKVTFSDVAGIDEAKDELEEIIEFLMDPKKFTKLGGRIPKGVLLMGPPGTGKTLLARAIAGEASVPFFSISGSDFVEMFVGVGASRVRDLFIQGKKNAPCIIFIDEIDAVGRHRGAGLGGGHDEREQTLNQLLVEMDGFESNEGVILIAATNRPDVLDPALLRPGRFDRRVVVPIPDIKGRLGILRVHSRKVPLNIDVDLSVLARGTPGFTGADLANMINEAALVAAREEGQKVAMRHMEMAKDKVMMGSERRSMIISEEERINTAYHEAGHALVASLIPGADPIHKVSIIPRGMALGLTQQLPIDEKHTYTKEYLLNSIAVLLGGRVAEELALDHLTTGAGNDLERVTSVARKMICEWGMSEDFGPVTFGKHDEMIFLGKEMAQHLEYSEDTSQRIDGEVDRIARDQYERTKKLITENRDALDRLAKMLLEYEVLDGDEIRQVIDNRPLERKPPDRKVASLDDDEEQPEQAKPLRAVPLDEQEETTENPEKQGDEERRSETPEPAEQPED